MNASIHPDHQSNKPQINICMGSACHQMGINQILPKLEQLIHQTNFSDKVDIRGAFCLGNCKDGITIQSGAQTITGINTINIEHKFFNEILPVLKTLIKNNDEKY